MVDQPINDGRTVMARERLHSQALSFVLHMSINSHLRPIHLEEPFSQPKAGPPSFRLLPDSHTWMEKAFWADQSLVPLLIVHTLVRLSVSSLTEPPTVSDKSMRLEDIPPVINQEIVLRLTMKRVRTHWHAAEQFSIRRGSYALREPTCR